MDETYSLGHAGAGMVMSKRKDAAGAPGIKRSKESEVAAVNNTKP